MVLQELQNLNFAVVPGAAATTNIPVGQIAAGVGPTLTVTVVAGGGYVPNGITLYYRMTSTNQFGQETAQGAEANTGAIATNNSSVNISWTAVAGATGYNLYRGTAAGQDYLVTKLGNVTSYVDTGRVAAINRPPSSNTTSPAQPPAIATPTTLAAADGGTGGGLAAATYYYRVSALNGYGETLAAAEVNSGALAVNHKATVTWDPMTGAGGYNVYRSTATGTETLYVTLRYNNAEFSSSSSTAVPTTTTITRADTGTQSVVQGNLIVANKVTFTDDGLSYGVGASSGTVPAANTTQNPNYAVMPAPTGLAAVAAATGGSMAAGTYYYVVTATNFVGETIASNEVNSGALSGTTSSVTLTWNGVPNAGGYKIYRGTAAGLEMFLASVQGQTSVTYTDTGTTTVKAATLAPTTNTTGISANDTVAAAINLTAPADLTPSIVATYPQNGVIQFSVTTAAAVVLLAYYRRPVFSR
jgi:hypothetical protein